MPYKDPEIRRAKTKQYQAARRKKIRQMTEVSVPAPRFCLWCKESIINKRNGAKFCSREHKTKFSDTKRDYAKEYQLNKCSRREQAKSYYYKDLAASRAKQLARQKSSLPLFAYHQSKRRAAKLLRTPSWLSIDDFWVIKEAHKLAALRTEKFGFAWHVDHIVPLQGATVSGLHVPWNLQIIPAIDNISKGNRFEAQS